MNEDIESKDTECFNAFSVSNEDRIKINNIDQELNVSTYLGANVTANSTRLVAAECAYFQKFLEPALVF